MRYLTCNADSAIATCHPHSLKNKKKPKSPTKAHTIQNFPYSDIIAATNNFSAATFLGKGSHGTVYKATLHGGALAAVKKTKTKTKTSNEIEILSHVQNPRIVNLIGFTNNNNNNKLIVVEYMPNGSLHEVLHSKIIKPPGWDLRIRFAVQVAKAVRFLHSSEPEIIHRDIKSSNVLIDEKLHARLGDFGLAIRGHVADSLVPPAGTLGYLDPCYLTPGDLSSKTDVFSFGVLLFEIASGRHAIDVRHSPPSLLDWAVPLVRRGEVAEICDPRIGAPPDMAAFRRMVVLAASCVRSTVERRPAMAEVVECLVALKKRFHAPVLWKRVKRRVVAREDLFNEFERSINCTRNGKVSSVSGVEYDCGTAAIRSRSVGSGFKINLGLDYPKQNRLGLGDRKVRLKRCRSMGFLRHYEKHNNGNDSKNDTVSLTEMALSKLAIMDKKLEQRMLEKPLVYYWHRVENQSN